VPKVTALPVKITRYTSGKTKHTSANSDMPIARSPYGGHFQKGKSGNPRGRPTGSENQSHMRLRALLAEDAEAVLRRVVQDALAGNMLAARLILDRVLPRRICRPPMELTLSALKTATDASAALSKIVAGAADGLLSTAEAADMSKVIEAFNQSLVVCELADKIKLLEAQLEDPRQ
jgi:hypothetical protein